MQIHYDVQNELHLTLNPGKNYTYQMFADFGGNRYYSNKKKFRTKGTSAVKGDVNQDGSVDIMDAALIIDMIKGKEKTNLTLADIDGNGEIDIMDVAALLDLIKTAK